jgi:hypothetical protein
LGHHDTVRAVRLLEPDGSCLTREIDMAESDRARLLASYDDQLAELRRYL